MKSQTSLVASHVRLREWALQVHECQNRPVGMEVGEWCAQNNITRANYYYRLRKVREACLAMTGQEELPTFVPLEEPVAVEQPVIPSPVEAAAAIVFPDGIRLELYSNGSSEFLSSLLKAVRHA